MLTMTPIRDSPNPASIYYMGVAMSLRLANDVQHQWHLFQHKPHFTSLNIVLLISKVTTMISTTARFFCSFQIHQKVSDTFGKWRYIKLPASRLASKKLSCLQLHTQRYRYDRTNFTHALRVCNGLAFFWCYLEIISYKIAFVIIKFATVTLT
jgi:hypothetical protein